MCNSARITFSVQEAWPPITELSGDNWSCTVKPSASGAFYAIWRVHSHSVPFRVCPSHFFHCMVQATQLQNEYNNIKSCYKIKSIDERKLQSILVFR